MNCYTHGGRAAVGVCGACQKAICHECVGRDAPRLLCTSCVARAGTPTWGWSGGSYGLLYEYRSPVTINGWPLVHMCFGNDPVTLRPRMAKGIIAIGNAAVGVLAIGGAAFGLFTIGGFSLGLIAAVGGFALGSGLSVGGLAIGSIAVGGAAVGFKYAIGGAAFGSAVVDAQRCDQLALDFARQWIARLPNACK
jgi:hypothetical protein